MRKQPKRKDFPLQGPAGTLEALLEAPQGDDLNGCAIVCHPHPLYGGTLQNKVVHMLARSFVGSGIASLRFNFRGVGKSAGVFDDGEGEVEDTLAAAAWMKNAFPGRPLWLAGFSFGAAIAVRAAHACKPAGLISVAPAVSRFMGKLDTQPECPWLILQGDQDELVDIDETIAWFNRLEPGPELEVLAGAEHFFHGKLVLLRNTVEEFVQRNQRCAVKPK